MNETFVIDDNEGGDNQQQLEYLGGEKTKKDSVEKTSDDKRLQSNMLIENNFKIMSTELHTTDKNSIIDGYLEFEEMPDFDDYNITDTNTSNVTVQQLKLDNNNSILGK